jgi:hypothetical protein
MRDVKMFFTNRFSCSRQNDVAGGACVQMESSAFKLSVQRIDDLPPAQSLPQHSDDSSSMTYPEPSDVLLQASQSISLYSESSCTTMPCIVPQIVAAQLAVDASDDSRAPMLENVAGSAWMAPFFNASAGSSPYDKWLAAMESAVKPYAVNSKKDWLRVVAMGAEDLHAAGRRNAASCAGSHPARNACKCSVTLRDRHAPYEHQVPVVILDVHFESGTPESVMMGALDVFHAQFPEAAAMAGAEVCIQQLGYSVSDRSEECLEGSLPQYPPRSPPSPPPPLPATPPPVAMTQTPPPGDIDGQTPPEGVPQPPPADDLPVDMPPEDTPPADTPPANTPPGDVFTGDEPAMPPGWTIDVGEPPGGGASASGMCSHCS